MAKKQTAAEYLHARDPEVRIILAELAEYAGKANWHWSFAVALVDEYPDKAMDHLVELEILLAHHISLERLDTIRAARAALTKLDRELPD
jgi:hypothetical protein